MFLYDIILVQGKENNNTYLKLLAKEKEQNVMATRQEKYPETKTFHYYNANPKNRITGDCWLRAVCTGLNEPYNEVLMEMVQVHLETGYDMSCDKAVEKYLTSKGWVKHKQPRKADNTKYTRAEFCRLLADKNKW